MKVLVTGGAGFIGSHLVEALLQRGESVRIIDNFSTGKRQNLEPFLDQVELVEGDIRSYHIVRDAVQDIEIILHQAALPSVPRSIRDPITTHEVSATGTLNILQAAKDAEVKRLIYASSSSVYGDSPVLPKHEEMAPEPMSPYAVAKLTGENYCQVFSKIFGLATVILRYFNVFGPRQDPSSQYAAVIPRFVEAMLNDRQPVIYGDGEQSRDFTYVTNVVQANLLAMTSPCGQGEIINCACGSPVTVNELVDHINDVLDSEIRPRYVAHRPGDIIHSRADIARAERLLGYQPSTDFREGIRRTIHAMEQAKLGGAIQS